LLPNTTDMSVLLAAILVWLIGVPVGFWILTALYPVRMKRLLRKSAALDQATMTIMAPVTQLTRSRPAAPIAGRQKLT
jgi:hypothetical protein